MNTELLKQYLKDKISLDQERENSWAGDDYLFGVYGDDEEVGLTLVETSQLEDDDNNSLFFQIIKDKNGQHYKVDYSRAGTYRSGYSYSLLEVTPVIQKEVIRYEWVKGIKG